MADVDAASSPSPPHPGGQAAAAGRDAALADASHRFSLVPPACCYLDWLLSPAWLRSTLSPALRTFLRFTTLAVSSQPSLAPSALLWDFEGFALLFFFLSQIKWLEFLLWCFFQKHSFKKILCCYRVKNNLKASLLNSVAADRFLRETSGRNTMKEGQDSTCLL